ncbi:hypothetical protein [Fusobacterium sp.]|uniref:hypothetical protein n=1 Tax=Fusobacterium sp. TaxID=68766 RepID=UPI002627CF43|nr:hypothetical protein [Fusobacterium sp.]
MPSLYEINLQREILREKSAEILAYFNNYMDKNNINSTEIKNPIVILYLNTIYIYSEIFGSKYDDIAKIEAANGQLDLALEVLKKLS